MEIKEKFDKVEQKIRTYTSEIEKYGSELFCDFYADPELSMELIIGPLKIDEGITYKLAEKIAEKYGVKLKQYDFSRGRWSEPRKYRYVFSVALPDAESEFDNAFERLLNASKELTEAKIRLLKKLGY